MPESNPFRQWIRLEQPRLGTRVVYATDDFFAAKERLIEPAEPAFVPDKYDDHGKWMDGWESRRRREPGHDYCVIKLGVSGILHGVEIDTRHFTGNFPPQASLEGCQCTEDIPQEDQQWHELLPRTTLQGDTQHFVPIAPDEAVTHLRFHIYPDGGVARLRLFGEVCVDPAAFDDSEIDLLALACGGRAVACSDEHYGSMHNLVFPGRGINMGDGWETARRRDGGNDWVILALGCRGTVNRIEVDTAHFKGNYPDRVAIDAICVEAQPDPSDLARADVTWQALLPETKIQADSRHHFDQLQQCGAVTHVRMRIIPDGGVSRLRLYGRRA